ncbi:MAG: O-antigen ligase family protein [Actinomycetota bacterium]|nr:O-antigen ligase family protein [Actinomycetota bacterium]
MPPVPLALGVSSCVTALLLWALHAVSGGFAAFLAALLCATVALGSVIVELFRLKPVLRALRGSVVLALAVYVPVLFDPRTDDVFNLPKYTLVVVGALLCGGLWIVDAVHRRGLARWRSGFQWPLFAVLIWAAVSTATAVDTHVALLGNYGSYDGLYGAIAFAVIALTAAEAFDVGDLRRVGGLFAFAGGSVVVLYGLIQLHDTSVSGSTWDFVHWHTTSFAGDIFSTFGNPNHLGGYLATILPIALVLGVAAKRLALRVVAGGFVVAVLVELLRTAARGAWVAAIAALAVLLLAVVPELKRRPLLMAGSAAGVLVVVAAGMAAFGRRLLHEPLSQLFASGGHTPVQQRFDIWHVAVHMALSRPLVGVGPDNFALVYPQHQSAAWVAALGPNFLVNGAHDLLMNILADQGFIGLLLFLVLITTLVVKTVGAMRRFRRTEIEEGATEVKREESRRNRLITGALAAGVVAYLVQALFNVQQVGLAFGFWLLVGTLGVAWRGAGVPESFRLGILMSPEVVDQPTEDDTRAETWPRTRRGRRRQVTMPWPAIAASVVVAVALGIAWVGADGPYRADHAAWAAQASILASGNQVTATYFTDMNHAIALNPWEPSYPATEGATLLSAAPHLSQPAQLVSVLKEARTAYARALSDERLDGNAADGLATADEDLARADKGNAIRYLQAARAAVRIAVADNPRDSQFQRLLDQLRASK